MRLPPTRRSAPIAELVRLQRDRAGPAEAEQKDAAELAAALSHGRKRPAARHVAEYEAAFATAQREAQARAMLGRDSWEVGVSAFREHGGELQLPDRTAIRGPAPRLSRGDRRIGTGARRTAACDGVEDVLQRQHPGTRWLPRSRRDPTDQLRSGADRGLALAQERDPIGDALAPDGRGPDDGALEN